MGLRSEKGMMHFTYTGMKTQVASNLQGNASLIMLDILLAELNHSIFWTSQVLGRITLALRFSAYFCLVTTGWRLRNASASDRWTVEKNGWQTLVAFLAPALFLDCWPAANTGFRFNFKTLRMSSHLYTASCTTESFRNSLKYLATESLFLTNHCA